MANTISPLAGFPPGRWAVVISDYNESVTGRLLTGALEKLSVSGVADDQVDVAHVPGAWELPVVAARFAECGQYAGVICLGAVIQGETMHHEYINSSVSHALQQLSVRTGLPVGFGLLTCQSLEQAMSRAGGRVGNKGAEAAEAALLIARLLEALPERSVR